MGQGECLELLKKKKVWMTVVSIADYLKQHPALIYRSLNKLLNQNEIMQRKVRKDYTKIIVIEWKAKK